MKKLFLLIFAVLLQMFCHGSMEMPRINRTPGINTVSPEQWAGEKIDRAGCSYMSCYDGKMLYLAFDVIQSGEIFGGNGRGLAYFNDHIAVTVGRNKNIGPLNIAVDAGGKLYVNENSKNVSAGQIKAESRIDKNKGYRILLQIPWKRISPDTPEPHAVTVNMVRVRVKRAFVYERQGFSEKFVPGEKKISAPEKSVFPDRHERVINFGRPGHNSLLIWQMLDAVLDCKPDLAVIMAGTNDVVWRLRWQNAVEYERCLRKICQKLNAAGCRIILVTIPPCLEEFVAKREKCTPEETKNLMPRINEINKVIVKLGSEYDLPVADFNAIFTGDLRSKKSMLRNPLNSGSTDGVHPTPGGYLKLAVMLKNIIDRHGLPTGRIACIGDSITYGVHVKGSGSNTGETYPGQLLKLLEK